MNANPNPYPHGRWTPRVASGAEQAPRVIQLPTVESIEGVPLQELYGVRQQSAAAMALWTGPTPGHTSQSGVALRLPPQSKSAGGASQAVGPIHGIFSKAA